MGMQAGGGVMGDINVTPLVDVMLVLLIIFMVAAPAMEKQRTEKALEEDRARQQRLVSLNLPSLDNSGGSEQGRTLTLKVSKDLVVTYEGKVVVDCSQERGAQDKRRWVPCLDKVEAAVRGSEEGRENGVIVDAEPEAKFGFIVGVMHRLHRAQVEKVSMFPNPTT